MSKRNFILGVDALPDGFYDLIHDGVATIHLEESHNLVPLKHAQYCKDVTVTLHGEKYHYGDVINLPD